MVFQYIFKRVEKKYILNTEQYNAVIEGIKQHMSIDKYGETTICNIYFDNENDILINISIDKPVYKEKLRLRSYGIPTSENDAIFFEIKKKYKGTVFKRRISLSLQQAQMYIESGEFPKCIDNQIAKEIDYMVKYWNIKPRVFLAYERTAWCSGEGTGLRITFDKNIRYRYENVSFNEGTDGTPVIPNHLCIMEIKIPNATPLWLSKLLSENNIFSHSFSKYGTAYTNTLLKGENKNV